jgi:Ca2+-binding RTX toxin-like protein
MRRAILLVGMIAVSLLVASGVALAVTRIGTLGADVPLMGTDNSDTLYGLSESDLLRGRGGNDYEEGGRHGDLVYGGDGNDEIYLGGGDDIALGHEGDDKIYLGGGSDLAVGNPGDDMINAIDGVRGNDFGVRGGAGHDTCYVDSPDELGTSCEAVIIAEQQM